MDNKDVTSGTQSTSSGVDSSVVTSSTSGEQEPKKDAAYEKLLREKKNYASNNAELKAELDSLREWKREVEEKDLIRKQEYEKLVELVKKENSELKNQLKDKETLITGAKVQSAILGELKKLGFVDNESNRELMSKAINCKVATIDPTTGVVVGAEDAAKEFYTKYNSLGFFSQKKAGVNQSAPTINVNDKPDINSMSREEKFKLLANLSK